MTEPVTALSPAGYAVNLIAADATEATAQRLVHELEYVPAGIAVKVLLSERVHVSCGASLSMEVVTIENIQEA
ncbi:hypothetical protein ACFO9Q_16970 [Paenibacillus sp. GCM10023252]|uniref:hypothetical protein n=1 Tax=Paenibacillus sp. GCM10023252 TaxID=3252649 RepID=UPI003606350E